MNSAHLLFSATTAGLVLSACTPAEPPAADTAPAVTAADHAAMGHDTTTTTTPGDAAFAASESAMHAEMAAASGDTVDQSYIAKMQAHHRGAVAMADVALAQSKDPEIRRMAQAVKSTQTAEIAEMQAWRPAPAAAN